MKKILLITLIILNCLGFSAVAEDPYFLPQHWIIGSVQAADDILTESEGKTISIFKVAESAAKLTTTIGSDYKFALNAYRLPSSTPWQPGDILLLKLEDFQGVDGKTYTAITQLQSQGSGFEKVVLHLVATGSENLPIIHLSANEDIAFTIEKDSPDNQTTSFNITNVGQGSLDPLIEIAEEATWISFINEGAPLTSGEQREVSLTASAQGLEVASYSTPMTVSDQIIPEVTTVTRNIILNVTDPSSPIPIIGISPDSLSFTAKENEANPDYQVAHIANLGNGTLIPEFETDVNWLILSAPNETLGIGESLNLEVLCNIIGLAPGLYPTTIIVKDKVNQAIENKEIGITLTVNKADPNLPGFSLTPSTLNFGAEQYTEIDPKSIIIYNTGNIDINYQISKTKDWLLLSETDGSIAPGVSNSFNVSIDQTWAWLNQGTYEDIITVSDQSGLAPEKTVSVVVEITEPTGPVEPEITQVGIERVDNNIKIMWNKKPNDLEIDLYLNTEPLNTPNWQKQNLSSGDFEEHLDENYFLHKNQVGAGASKAYYKLVPKDQPWQPALTLGKANLECEKGFNLVSFPFDFEGKNSLDEVIGDQLSPGSSKDGDIIFDKKDAISFSYNWAYLNNDGNWKNIDDHNNPNFTIDPAKGYFIWHQPAEAKTVTVVGKIIKGPVTTKLAEGFNLIGTIYANEPSLTEAGFTNAYAADSKDADIMFKKKNATSFSYDWSFNGLDNNWHNVDAPNQDSNFKFSPFNGYYYWRRAGQGELSWEK